MIPALVFILLSIPSLWVSWPSLGQPRSHGFFRFFAWEAILGLLAINLNVWFVDPFSPRQIISWLLLLAAIPPVILGVITLRRFGESHGPIEATRRLVREGIYGYIRHPLYASLIFLAWGIFFKAPSLLGGCLAVIATACLYATATADESECQQKFGDEYEEYVQQTRRLIPFIF